MYQALYRKYRPSTFDDVVGQTVVVQTLKNAIIENKVTHAYLFTGPRGTGKTSIAKIFAKTINCEDPKNGIPCKKCVSCTQIEEHKSTDIIEIDAASNNGVDEIRELKSKVTLVPNVSKYKVYIVDEVHMLTQGAFNALLKTLEEPPSHVIFILATTEPHKIPATILSRCQRYDFKKIPTENIVERLRFICNEENIKIEEEALQEIARISDGGMRDAISILDQVISFKVTDITSTDVHQVNGTLTKEELIPFIKSLLENDIETVFNKIDQYNSSGINLQKLIDEIILSLRNILLYSKVPKYLEKKESNIEIYKEINNIASDYKIYTLINSFNSLATKLKTSTNPKIIFEVEMLNNMNISQDIAVEKVVEQPKAKVVEKPKKVEEPDSIEESITKTDEFKQFKDIRINNILAKLNKKIMMKVLEDRKILQNYLLDKDFGKYSSLLLDGNIKAASDEGLLYVYEYEEDVELFNNNIKELEDFLKSKLEDNFKLIAVDKNSWEIIKNEFNSKTKTYEYKEELYFPGNKKTKQAKKNEMEKMFDNIVEYTKEEF